MALTTTATVKSVLAITTSAQDALIDSVVAGVSSAIARDCRRWDERTAVSLLERQTGRIEYPRIVGNKLILRCYPIEAITELKQASDRNFTTATALVEGTDFVRDDERPDALIALTVGWLTEPRTVRCTYSGAYWTGAVGSLPAGAIMLPSDLSLAATLQAVHEFRHRDKFGERQIAIGDMSVSQVTDSLLDIVRERIAPYRSYA